MPITDNNKIYIKYKNKTIWFYVIASIVIIGALLSLRCFFDYKREMSLLEDRLTAQVRVVDENICANMAVIDLILENIRQTIAEAPSFEHDKLNEYLKHQKDIIPGIITILIIDSHGYCTHSNQKILIGKDFSSRDYYLTPHNAINENLLFVSPPFKNVFGTIVLHITKPIIGKDGNFNGVVSIGLAPEYFETLLRSTIYAPDNRIALIHSDGTVFIATPKSNISSVGQNLMNPGTMVFRHIQDGKPFSVQIGRSATTGEKREFVYITNMPKGLILDKKLIISASRNIDEVLLPWKLNTIFTLTLYLILSAIIINLTNKMIKRGDDLVIAYDNQSSILDSAGEGIIGIDLYGTVLFCNQAAEQLTGRTRNMLLGSNFHKSLHSDASGHDSANCPIHLTLNNGTRITVNNCVLENIGSVEYTATPLFEHGIIAGAVIVFRDVSERRKLEIEHAKTAEYNRALLDSITANIAILDKDGLIVSVNDAWNKFAKTNLTEMGELPRNIDVGSNYLDVCLKSTGEFSDQAKEAAEGIRSVLNGSKKTFSLEYSCHFLDTQRWFFMTVEHLRTPDGGAVVSHTNITKRKEIEIALRESEENYSTLFDNAYDAILILDPKGRILRANKILYHKLGYTEDELLGKTPSLFDTPKFAELVPSRMLQVAEFGVAFFESEHVAKDGMIYPVEISCRAIELGGNTVFMGIARDISERKRMELSLRQALEDAETANATMKRLLNTVAHEFRTPLSLITSSIDILNCYSDRLTKEQRAEQNDYIRSAAHQMRELINSILSFNIMEPNENIQEPELLNISQYCRTIASEVCSIYKMEEYFNINISENCGTAKLNKTLFRRILENLLTNAFKYTPLGGTVSLSIDCENKRLVIMIADSGIGIASKDKQHIFDSFYRGQNVEDRRGLGLGLSIVHDALSQMGGAIHVDSTIGEGTAIKVDLPVDDLSCCEEEIHVLNSDN